MPGWWWELLGIPGVNDYKRLARKIQALFEMMQARINAKGGVNDYGALLSPECVCLAAFMPTQDLRTIQESRCQMDPFVTFSEKVVLEGAVLPKEQTMETPLVETPHAASQEEPEVPAVPQNTGQLSITKKASSDSAEEPDAHLVQYTPDERYPGWTEQFHSP